MKITETNVTILVKDLDAAIKFYESIGLKLKNRWGEHYAMVETTGLTIGLHPNGGEAAEPGDQISLGFMVEKAQEAKTLLDKNGITYKWEDGKSGTYLHFKDLDGTVLYFTEPKWSR